MSKRIVIVGGVAGGASAAAKARRTSEQAEIVLLEAGPHVSFANCGLPYYLGREIPRRQDLFVASPEMFRTRFNVDVRLSTEAVSIDSAKGTVEARDASGGTAALPYDRLVLATGTIAVTPNVPGLTECGRVLFCRTIPDVDALDRRIRDLLGHEDNSVGPPAMPAAGLRALVVGGGYVGLEVAEQLLRRGLAVTLVELLGQVMSPLDEEMAQPLQAALESAGAEVVLNDAVQRVEVGPRGRPGAVLRSGRRVEFDLGVMGVGVRPNVALAQSAGVRLGQTGAIEVDAFQRTSDPAIYAAGDNCQSAFLLTGGPVNIPLAGPANRQGRVAGANAALDLLGAPDDDPRRLRFRGVLGSAVVRVGKVVAGLTGLTEKAAGKTGRQVAVTYLSGPHHASYYPGAEQMLVKVLYDPCDGKVLGAQVVGGQGVDKRLDVLATAIYGGLTVEDLEQLDLCYAPPFGSAKDVVTLAGFVAANARRGVSPAVTPRQLLEELEGDDPPLVVDVRSPREYASGHLQQAVNIPVDQMRRRAGEVPADRPVVVHCGVGYRSYLAQQILRDHGRTNVRNLLGGYGLLDRMRKLHRQG